MPQGYDIRAFDTESYEAGILQQRSESHASYYAAAFGPGTSGEADGALFVSCSNGDVRYLDTLDMKRRMALAHASPTWQGSWRAHQGAAYCMARVSSDCSQLLCTGGDDGHVRAWRLPVAPERSTPACPQLSTPATPQPMAAAADVAVLRAESPLGPAAAASGGHSPPAVLCLQHDGEHTLFAGGSDGGVSVLDMERMGMSATATSSAPCSAGSAAAWSAHVLHGHAAAVHCMDWCAATRQLVTGSEDGTVRVWDVRTGKAVSVLDPHRGVVVRDTPADCLACARSPHVPCVRFDTSGEWLVVGLGRSSRPGLCLWSMGLGAPAAHIATPSPPQVCVLVPGEILTAGREPHVLRHTFAGVTTYKQQVRVRSVFGLCVGAARGEVAVCGVGGVEVLSARGQHLGCLTPLGEAD